MPILVWTKVVALGCPRRTNVSMRKEKKNAQCCGWVAVLQEEEEGDARADLEF